MKDLKKYIFPLVLIFHFGLMLIFNLNYCLKSQIKLYHSEEPYFAEIYQKVQKVSALIGNFRNYQAITGTNTAYGFYAPQVSGYLEPYFDLFTDDDKIVSYYNVRFSTQEADLRFHTAFSRYLQKLDKLFEGEELAKVNKNKYFRFLDLKMQSLCTHVLNRVHSANRIKANLYLYAVPSMQQYTNGEVAFKASFLKTFEYEYFTQ